MRNERAPRAIQIGLTGHIHREGKSRDVDIVGLGFENSQVRLRLYGWEALQAVLALCDEAITDIRAECAHTSHDDLVGLGLCDWCGMTEEEVEDQRKSMEV